MLEKTNQHPLNDPFNITRFEKDKKTKTPTVISLVNSMKSKEKPKRGMEQAESVSYEKVQFERWSNLFRTTKANGEPTRKGGGKKDAERFITQMMPADVRWKWGKDKTSNTLSITHNGTQVFYSKGTLKNIFNKLFEHYGNHRAKYFEEKYGTIFPKESFVKIFEKGLVPPQVIEKEVRVEVPVKEIVEVPGKSIDRLQEALTAIPMIILEVLDGHKRLPPQFSHVHDVEASTKGNGWIDIKLILKP
jgi:hypothetical protein